jgi:putative hydrolase of the HAD superfamily
MSKEYSTYVFDVGGTLIKFDEERRAAAYAKRAATVGINTPVPEIARVLQALDRELPERTREVKLSLLSVEEQRAFWLDFWAEGFRQIGVDDANALRFADELLDPAHGGNFQVTFPDTIPALQQLRACGKRLGIVSNWSPNCQTLLDDMGLAQYFDFFIVSGVIGIEKPDPRIFDAAVQASGKPITELLYIGDSVFHDVQGAQNAGMDAILIDRSDVCTLKNITRVRDLRELCAD